MNRDMFLPSAYADTPAEDEGPSKTLQMLSDNGFGEGIMTKLATDPNVTFTLSNIFFLVRNQRRPQRHLSTSIPIWQELEASSETQTSEGHDIRLV